MSVQLERDDDRAVERRTDPGEPWSRAERLIHTTARVGVAVVFAYQGLVPKLLASDLDELSMIGNAGIPLGSVTIAAKALGIAELLLAACLVVFWQDRWPSRVALALVTAAAIGVSASSPESLTRAFNPLTLNIALGCLASIDLIILQRVASGRTAAGAAR